MGTSAARRLLPEGPMRMVLGLLITAAIGCSDSGSSPRICPTPEPFPGVTADAGTLSALKAQRCNVSGSMGQRKWYRLSASLAGSADDVVQLELYDSAGPFAGGSVRAGTFPVESSAGECGVCLRALGDKGLATETEYIATGGMVTIGAIGTDGQPISVTITNATFTELGVEATPPNVPCTATLGTIKIDGTVMDVGGGGSGGGGGGGGQCPATIGD